MCLQYMPFENTVGKGEIAQQAISPFPKVFSTYLENILPFSPNLKLLSANSFSLEESKTYGLTHSHTMTPFDAPGKQAF